MAKKKSKKRIWLIRDRLHGYSMVFETEPLFSRTSQIWINRSRYYIGEYFITKILGIRLPKGKKGIIELTFKPKVSRGNLAAESEFKSAVVAELKAKIKSLKTSEGKYE